MGLHLLATSDVFAGDYLSWIKAIPVLVILLAWARALSWADKDAVEARMPRDAINSGMMAGLVIAFAAFVLLPAPYVVGLAAILVVVGVEAGVYLSMRNKAVGLKDLKGDFVLWVKSVGRKPREVEEVAGAVQLVGADGKLLPAPKANAPEAESYEAIQRMLTDPLNNNADVIEVAPGEGGSTVKYSVDGVSYTGSSVGKTLAADAMVYLKAAAGLDIGEVRKPQKGGLKLNINGKRKEMSLETKGSTAGEFARFVGNAKSRHDFDPQTLGLTLEQLDAIIKVNQSPGLTILAAPKGQGLTSLSYGMLRAHDAFLQLVMAIERDQEQDLEGITQTKLDRNVTAAEEAKQVRWILSQLPDVLLVGKPESSDSAVELVKAAAERRVYVSLVASSTFEALNQWRKLVGDDKLAVQNLQLIICGRNLRRLCNACKQAYTPDPETLKKLNMDPARVEKLYQARKEPVRDPKGNPIKCDFCNDLRYKGRTGIYEMLLVDEHVRQVATNGQSAEQNATPMKTAFRKQRGKYLQEVGLGMVEEGETSVQEVLRVLKGGADGTPPPGNPPGGGSSPAAPRSPKPKPAQAKVATA